MSFVEESSTRFFAVVGAAYIPEHHFNSDDDDLEHQALHQCGFGVTSPPRSGSTGWWLNG